MSIDFNIKLATVNNMNPKYYLSDLIFKGLRLSKKTFILLKALIRYRSPIHYASFDIFGAKIDQFFEIGL